MAKIWAWYKKISLWFGMVTIPLIIMLIATDDKKVEQLQPTDNFIDDALYYAYNAENFGWLAEIWRLVTIYAIYFLAKAIVLKAISKFKIRNNKALEIA